MVSQRGRRTLARRIFTHAHRIGGPGPGGLPFPLLVISDGAPGLITAIEQAFPKALRQRCLIHYADLGIMPIRMVEPLVAAV